MSAKPCEWDLSDLETIWARRAARLEAVAGLLDRRGATCPRRNTAERDWLAERGELPPTQEIATPLNERGSTPRPGMHQI